MLSRTANRLAGGGGTIHHHHHHGTTTISSLSSIHSRILKTITLPTTKRMTTSTRTRAAASSSALLTQSSFSDNYSNKSYSMLLAASTTLATLSAALLSQQTSITHLEEAKDETEEEEDRTTIMNWSGTHTITPLTYHEPETLLSLLSIVRHAHTHSHPLRPVGSALSPNGISFSWGGMISLSNLDAILEINSSMTGPGAMTVKVQAGARVSQVIDELRPHGLTLPNLASIAEQQMGGFTQIGAHGTGASIAPIDEYVTELTLVTPAEGLVTLSQKDADGGEMFRMARVGLGCLGIVADVTMKVIPAHRLLEHTFTLTRAEAKAQLGKLLKEHRHVRYMWIPYEDTVIVVTNDVEDEESVGIVEKAGVIPSERLAPLQNLLINLTKNAAEPYTMENLEGKGFGALRDAIIALNPLDVEHMKVVNKAEAEFWRKSEGYQLKNSDELLQFDCGGQQWVYEVCLPTGTYETNNGNDMKFMDNLLSEIEREQIPAHPPIEQRWSASSSSDMSPAYGKVGEGGLFCWVGIIMYLPDEGEKIRQAITHKFQNQYCDLAKRVGTPLQTVSHWGKLEMPMSPQDYERLRSSMLRRYPVEEFNAARLRFDPKNILGNRLVDVVLGTPDPKLIFPRR